MKLLSRESAADALAELERLRADGSKEGYSEFAERAVERFPKDARIRLECAVALADGKRDEAVAHALRVPDLDKSADPALLARTAHLLLILGELAGARTCAETAILAGPTNVVIVNKLTAIKGVVAAREGDYESAERHLRAAYEADPTDESCARELAVVIAGRPGKGVRYAEAIAVLDRTLATPLAPASNSAAERATLKVLRTKLQGHLERVMHQTGLEDSTMARATTANNDEQRPPSDMLGEGPSPDREHPRGRDASEKLAEARSLLARGPEKKYISFTERAVNRYPDDAALRLEYATALSSRDPEKSRLEALKVAELDAENELERAALVVRAARLLLQLGDSEGAQSLADLASDFAPSQVTIRNELTGLRGAIAAATGVADRAEQELRAAHSADPIHSIFALDLAELLIARDRREEALAVIERTLATPERPGIFQARAARKLERLREDLQARRDDSNQR